MIRSNRQLVLLPIVLLFFMLYLLVRMGFSPFHGNTGQLAIPDLRGLTYQEAQQTLVSQGFRLTSQNGTFGLISDQSPRSTTRGNRGDTITVRMDPNETKVPPALVGIALEKAEQSITGAHLKFMVVSAGQHTGIPNMVSQIIPAPGNFLAVGSVVTLYVWNLSPTH